MQLSTDLLEHVVPVLAQLIAGLARLPRAKASRASHLWSKCGAGLVSGG